MLIMLNNRVNYAKRSSISCEHDSLDHFKRWKNVLNLNDYIDHGK